jgi:hypothetical protein
MVKKVTIKGAFHNSFTFPSLNDYLQACGYSPMKGAKLKKDCEMICAMELRKQLLRTTFEPPVCFHYKFYEPTKARSRKRDCANIFSMFDKCFEDAFVHCGYIKDDGPAYMLMPTAEHYFTDGVPYIEIYIEDGLEKGTNTYIFKVDEVINELPRSTDN